MIRVLIVDDQRVVTEGLKVLLSAEPDIEIVETGANGQEAIALTEKCQPDVLLIDQHMPVLSGVEATRHLAQRYPDMAILLLSGSDADESVKAALQFGARGYLLKTTSAEGLASSIRSAHRGYTQVGPGLLEKLIAPNLASPASQPSLTSVPQDRGTPQSSDEFDPALSELRQILAEPQQFDPDEMSQLIRTIAASPQAGECLCILEQHLKLHPDHIAAHYLYAHLSSELQQTSQVSVPHFQKAFQLATEQEFPLSIVLHICREAWLIEPDKAFDWLISLLLQEPLTSSRKHFFDTLSSIFGKNTKLYRLLRARWEIALLTDLCAQVR